MNSEMMIGEVIGVHGIRGEIKVRPETDDPGRYYELDDVILLHKGKKQTFAVELVRLHKGSVLLSLEGISDRNEAEAYKGAFVMVPRESAVDLETDEFFISDLIGMMVKDSHQSLIGKVKNVLTTTGAVDTLEISTAEGTVFVPFRKDYFLKVDFETDEITADIPQAFFELNR